MAPEKPAIPSRVREPALSVAVLEQATAQAEGQEEEEMTEAGACSFCGGELSAIVGFAVTFQPDAARFACSDCATIIGESTSLIKEALDRSQTITWNQVLKNMIVKHGEGARVRVKNCVSAAIGAFLPEQKTNEN